LHYQIVIERVLNACCSVEERRDEAPEVKDAPDAISRRASRSGVDTGLFFALFYLYVWLAIDPRLIHHTLGLVTPYHPFSFTTGWPFLWEHLAIPGGLVMYGSRYLTALYTVGWLGALIVTAAAWTMSLGIDVLTRRSGQPRGMVIRYVPAVLMLVIYNGNGYPLRSILSFLVALFCFVIYLRLAARGTAKVSASLVVISVVAYYVGGSASLLFPLLVAIAEALITRRKAVALTALLCGMGVPCRVGGMLFGLPFGEAYGGFLSQQSGKSAAWTGRYVLAIFLCFPAVLAGTALWGAVVARRVAKAADPTSSEEGSSWMRRIAHFLSVGESRWSMKIAAVCLAAGTIAWFTSDRHGRLELRMDYYCQQGMWLDALEPADRMARDYYCVPCNWNVMLALCHTDRLGDEMFRYPQWVGDNSFLMLSMEKDPHTYLQASRFYLGIGHVNLAELCAYEALLMTGDVPWILHHLAVINIIKDQPEAAKIFLNALSKKPLHHRAAKEMLRRLEEDPRLESDAWVQQVRRSIVRKDTVMAKYEEDLVALVEENPDNRIALNYLMAYYLRASRSDKVVENLRHFDHLENGALPRHYQEAIIVHARRDGDTVPSREARVGAETLGRAEVFAELVASSPNLEEARQRAAEAGLGDSYFFYLLFGVSGW